jgi:hypothetical protein
MHSRPAGSGSVASESCCAPSHTDVRVSRLRKPSRNLAMGVAAALTLMSGSAALANAAVAPAAAARTSHRVGHPRSPRHHASAARPVLNAHGHKLTWPAAAKVSKYVLATLAAPSVRKLATYRVLTGTSFTPPTVPGHTMKYRLRANSSATNWSKVVSIKYSAKASPTPAASAGTPSATAALSGPMMVGLNSGWGTQSAADMADSFGLARMDTTDGGTEVPSTYHAVGIKVIATFPGDVGGDYNTGGVSAINITNWVSMVTKYYANQCLASTSYCPAIEVLNEPYGSWFWGANAEDAQNEAAYANLVKAVYQGFHSEYGANAPKILAAYNSDAGSSSSAWWAGMVAAVPNMTSYFDGVVVHPYGGTGSVASSALGNRALVTQAHNDTGKPAWVTEIGWPTAVGQPATGDSRQWTETQQAANIYNFINWARSTGYVAAVTYFNYVDYSTNMWYGLERSATDGAGAVQFSKKPGWYALAEAAASQACTVCSAA